MGNFWKFIGDIGYGLHIDWLAQAGYERARKAGVPLEWPKDKK